MKIKIQINATNAAFEDNESFETARILRELADKIEGHPNFSPGHDQALRDLNGNEVGFFGIYQTR